VWLRAHWIFVLIVAVLVIIVLILGLKNKCEPCPECKTISQEDIETACKSAGGESFSQITHTLNENATILSRNTDVLDANKETLNKNTETLASVATAKQTATKTQVAALQSHTTDIQKQLHEIGEDARHCVPAQTTLTAGVGKNAVELEVVSAADFPKSGLLAVGQTNELISYKHRNNTKFWGLSRGCSATEAMTHFRDADVVQVDPATGTCLRPPPTLAPLAKSFWFIPTSGHVPGLGAGPIPLHYDKVEALTNEDPKTKTVTTVHSIVGASIFLPPEGTTDARYGVKWTLPRSILCEQAAFLPVKFGPLQGNITCMFE
jgi:hypothetical protein